MYIITQSEPIARKNHTCDFCGCIIYKGDRYSYSTNKYDGTLYTWKSHLSCVDLINALDMDNLGEGITGEDFVECVKDAFSNLKLEVPETFEELITIVKSHYLKK